MNTSLHDRSIRSERIDNRYLLAVDQYQIKVSPFSENHASLRDMSSSQE